MTRDETSKAGGGKYAAQAYWNALAKLRFAWKEVFDEDLPTVGNHAKDSFEQAIERVKDQLMIDAAGARKLRAVLDVAPADDVGEVLLGSANMDNLSPGEVKQAMLDACVKLGAGRHSLPKMLRLVLKALFASDKTRRPRAGANRHWPRLLQYLRELEEETDWSPEGRGIHLMNAGGPGPVARQPRDPARLVVRVDPDHL